MRAHFIRPITDEQGNILPNAQISVYYPATTALISQVLYSTDTGNNVLTNPYVSPTGLIDFYLDTPMRVRIGIVQGGLPIQYYNDVDVLAAGSDSQHTGAGINSLVIGPTAVSSGDTSVALGSSATSSGLGASAVGPMTDALGNFSTAVGSGASTSGLGSIAAGRDAQAVGDASTAVGNSAQTGAQSAVAVGDGAVSAYAHSSALGPGAATTQANQVMLGTSLDIVEIPSGAALVLSDANGVRWVLTIGTDGSVGTSPA